MQAASMASATFDSVDPEHYKQRRESLRAIFEAFANGPEMDGRAFAKFCKDTGLAGKKLSSTDIDLIFASVKGKDERKINTSQFRNALDAVGSKLGKRTEELIDIILKAEGPTYSGTRVEEQGNLAAPLKAGSRRGSFLSSVGAHGSEHKLPLISSSPVSRSSPAAHSSKATVLSPAQLTLKEAYLRYSPYGEMDGKTFAKVARDARMLDAKLSTIDMDIIFAKVKEQLARRINLNQFEAGLREMALKKGVAFEVLVDDIKATNGPLFEATVAEASNRFFDRSSGQGSESAQLPSFVNGKVLTDKLLSAAVPKAKKAAIDPQLAEAFSSFAAGGEMDGKAFSKLARDSQILGKGLTNTDVDLIFAKVKSKGERKLTLEQFYQGLVEIAERKGEAYESVLSAIVSCGGPQFVGTKADAVKWYDDKSTFTGMHTSGEVGDRQVRTSSVKRLSSLESHVQDARMPALNIPAAQIDSIREVFSAFSQSGEIDGRSWQKLIKDSGLLTKGLTIIDLDLIFASVKHVNAKRINFNQFIDALAEVANKSGIQHDDIALAILEVGGPQYVGTKADFVKFYDDKSLFTGMHSDEGYVKKPAEQKKSTPAQDEDDISMIFEQYAPTGEMDGKTFAKLIIDASVLDRNLTLMEIDVVFAKVKTKGGRKITYRQFLDALGDCAMRKLVDTPVLVQRIVSAGGPQFFGTLPEANKFHDDKSLYTGMHGAQEPVRELPKSLARRVVITQDPAASLEELFSRFSPLGEMDGRTFCKVAKDAQLFDKSLTSIDMDIFFAKVKDKALRKISFSQFQDGVREMAAKKGMSFDELSQVLMQCGGPVIEGTVAEAIKHHDDKSYYSGMHGQEEPNLALLGQTKSSAQRVLVEVSSGPVGSLEEVFQLFAPSGEMDGRSFAKMARDSGIIGKNLTPPDIDLVFAKARGKALKIDFEKFMEGIKDIADRKKVEYDDLCQDIMKSGGPKLVGTHAEANNFYDSR